MISEIASKIPRSIKLHNQWLYSVLQVNYANNKVNVDPKNWKPCADHVLGTEVELVKSSAFTLSRTYPFYKKSSAEVPMFPDKCEWCLWINSCSHEVFSSEASNNQKSSHIEI